MFSVGQTVVCINAKALPSNNGFGKLPPLKEGAKYIIGDLHKCKCGNIQLDVGIVPHMQIGTLCGCGNLLGPNSVHWCHHSRFASIEEKTEEAKIVTFEKITEDIPMFAN